MSLLYKNKACISLILKELEINREFLPFSESEIESYLSKIDSISTFEKYYIENNLAGFISYYCNNEETKEAFITLVLVDRNYRGMNIAKKLMAKVIEKVKEKGFLQCGLQVRADNVNAINLYSKIGFSEKYRKGHIISMSILV